MAPQLRSAILASIALTLLAALAAPADALPGVRFKSYSDYYEPEGVGTVALIVEVTEPPTVPASISWATRDWSSATPGVDFVEDSGVLTWDVGDDSDREIVVTILQDSEDESGGIRDEHFGAVLDSATAVGLETRAPHFGSVHILDDDGAAYFVVDDVVERNWLGQINLMGEAGVPGELTIRLSAPPTTPVTIQYRVDQIIHSVVFNGVQEQVVTIDTPEVPPGEDFGFQEVAILGPPARRRGVEDLQRAWSVEDVQRAFFTGWNPAWCPYCVMVFLGSLLGGDPDEHCTALCILCDEYWESRARGGDTPGERSYATLTRYRDEVLSQTPEGLFYAELYEALSGAVSNSLLRHPWFIYEALRAKADWVDAFQAVVDGTGASVVITPTMQVSLDKVLDRFIELGDPVLVTAVQTETTRLDLRNLEGLTMDDFQDVIESSGASSVEDVSWGKVKARYR